MASGKSGRTGQAEVSGVAYLRFATIELGKAIRGGCGIPRRRAMSNSDVAKTAEAKAKVNKELGEIIRKLSAGTIDRKKLVSGLKKVKGTVKYMPPHRR
jgi:hypothetical protein